MKSDNERGRDVETAGEDSEAAEAARPGSRTREISEAVVAAIPAEGEVVAAAPAESPRWLRTRVISEAVVAAIPSEAESESGGGADDEAGARA